MPTGPSSVCSHPKCGLGGASNAAGSTGASQELCYEPGIENLARDGLRAGIGVCNDEFPVGLVQRIGTTDHHLSRQISRLRKDIVQPRPMDGEHDHLSLLGDVTRRTDACRWSRSLSQISQLLLAARVTEEDFVSQASEDRTDVSAHQS